MHLRERSLAHTPGCLLGLRCLLGGSYQTIAFVATGEHALAAALPELADLPPRSQPGPPAARDGDAREVLRQILQTLDHPRVGEQPCS